MLFNQSPTNPPDTYPYFHQISLASLPPELSSTPYCVRNSSKRPGSPKRLAEQPHLNLPPTPLEHPELRQAQKWSSPDHTLPYAHTFLAFAAWALIRQCFPACTMRLSPQINSEVGAAQIFLLCASRSFRRAGRFKQRYQVSPERGATAAIFTFLDGRSPQKRRIVLLAQSKFLSFFAVPPQIYSDVRQVPPQTPTQVPHRLPPDCW